MPRLSVLLLTLALAAPALAQKPAVKASSSAKPAASTASAGPDRPSRLRPGAPVCVVDGVVIPLSTYIDRLSLRYGPEIREALIEEAVLRAEAARRKIAVTPAELDGMVRKSYGEALRHYGDEKALAAELEKSRGWSIADFKSVLREQAEVPALRGKLAAILVKADAVTEAEIAKRYEQQKDAFLQPDTVRIAHILIKRSGDSAAADAAARKQAEELLKQLVESNGARFEALAKEKSQDPATASRGGVIPVEIPRGANPFGAAFEATVYNAPLGLVREVIASRDGYHLVRVDAKQEARALPLAEVKEQLRAALLTEKRDQAVDALLVRLRTAAKISTGKF